MKEILCFLVAWTLSYSAHWKNAIIDTVKVVAWFISVRSCRRWSNDTLKVWISRYFSIFFDAFNSVALQHRQEPLPNANVSRKDLLSWWYMENPSKAPLLQLSVPLCGFNGALQSRPEISELQLNKVAQLGFSWPQQLGRPPVGLLSLLFARKALIINNSEQEPLYYQMQCFVLSAREILLLKPSIFVPRLQQEVNVAGVSPFSLGPFPHCYLILYSYWLFF